MKAINWGKFHRFQNKTGWCGPAVVQMALLAGGIRKSQKEIAKDVYKSWWGTNQNIILAYLSRFFGLVNFKQNAKISDINGHLKKGHVVIVNWYDDLDVFDQDGHYSIVAKYDPKKKTLTLADPSKQRKGLWNIPVKEFNSKWYDYLDVYGKVWVDGWMLWVDPSTRL